MKAEEYKSLINQKDVLDHETLKVTLKELVAGQEFELAAKIKGILANNQIAKPLLHADPYATSSTYYTINLAEEDILKIRDVFFDLEVGSIGGSGSPAATFYASIVDKWNNMV